MSHEKSTPPDGCGRVRHSCKYPSCPNKCRYPVVPPYVNKKFHKFPNDHKVQQAWKDKCNLPSDVKSDHFYVCQDHFKPADYTYSGMLCKGAVPRSASELLNTGPSLVNPVDITPQSDTWNVGCVINKTKKHSLSTEATNPMLSHSKASSKRLSSDHKYSWTDVANSKVLLGHRDVNISIASPVKQDDLVVSVPITEHSYCNQKS